MISHDKRPESRDCYWAETRVGGLFSVRFESPELARSYAERALENYDGPDIGLAVREPREMGAGWDPLMWSVFQAKCDHPLSAEAFERRRLYVASLGTAAGDAEVGFNADLRPAGFLMGAKHCAKLGLQESDAIDFLGLPWSARADSNWE